MLLWRETWDAPSTKASAQLCDIGSGAEKCLYLNTQTAAPALNTRTKGIIMANQLQYEKSPYLLQHAENPVDWRPWGTEALEEAKREDKLIFLSIGFTGQCIWSFVCHVSAKCLCAPTVSA